MEANAPVIPVLPTAYQGKTLEIDGQTIEIRGTEGELKHRPYLWIPPMQRSWGMWLCTVTFIYGWPMHKQTVSAKLGLNNSMRWQHLSQKWSSQGI